MDNYYPDEPGHVKGSATSKAAAESIKPKRKTLCDKILNHIVMSPFGLTSTNVVEITDIAINSVTARLRELQLSGAIREFGTRQCPNSGRHKNIYVATGTPHKAVKKVRVKTREKKLLEQISQLKAKADLFDEMTRAVIGYKKTAKIRSKKAENSKLREDWGFMEKKLDNLLGRIENVNKMKGIN